jgi:hypothetical protein
MKRLVSTAVFGIPAVLLLTSGVAEASDSQVWTGGTVTVRLSDRWALSQDFTARFSDKRDGLYELEANSLVGFHLNKVVTLWAGYDHDPQYAAGHFTIMEHRLPQIVSFDNFVNLGPGKFSGRVRLEERWRDGTSGTGWRVRPYLRYTMPFSKSSKVTFYISEEPFFDVNTTGFQKVPGLERLRSLAAVSVPLGKKLGADIGYMNQHGFVPHAKDTNDNIAYFSVGLKL